MNESVHGVTPGRDRGRLCAAVIVERVDTSRAKSIRGKGEVPWTGNQAGVLLNIRLSSLGVNVLYLFSSPLPLTM